MELRVEDMTKRTRRMEEEKEDKQEKKRGKKIKRQRKEIRERKKIPSFTNGENQFPSPRTVGYSMTEL
jgi:hypothetical protein